MHRGFTYGDPYRYGYSLPKTSALPQKWAQDIQCVHPSNHPEKGAIYVSNVEAASNHNTLSKFNIKAVMTCAKGHDRNIPKSKLDMFEYFPFDDKESCNISPYFERACDFIARATQKTNVLVHCIAGVSRSVSMVLAYLIREKGMSYEEAYQAVKSRRKIISPNQGFIKQLKDYAHKIKAQMNSPKINSRTPQKSQFHRVQKQRFYNTLVQKNTQEQQKQRRNQQNEEDTQKSKNKVSQYRATTPEIKNRRHEFETSYQKGSKQLQNNLNQSTMLTKSPTMLDSHAFSTPQKKKISYSTQNSSNAFSNNNSLHFNTGQNYNRQNYTNSKECYSNSSQINYRKNDYYKQMSKQLNDNINAIHAKYEKQREELLNRRNYNNQRRTIIDHSPDFSSKHEKYEKYKEMSNFNNFASTAKYSQRWEGKVGARYSEMSNQSSYNYYYYRSPCY